MKSLKDRATGSHLRNLLLVTTALALPAAAGAQTQTSAAAPEGISDIIITATKTTQNLQDVPISVQVFDTQALSNLQVQSFNDYVRFLPSVTYQTSGPGTAKVYFRGVSSGENANHSTSQPTVGIYLDEQPVTTISGAVDVHMYDIARVEALAGPQGTLFGSSSMAGTIRIITNKPDPSKFSASVDAELNSVTDGGMGGVLEGYVNVPLSDRVAVRAVGWYRKDAGYIDNIFQTRVYPTSGIEATTAPYVKKDYNDVETIGGRIALGIELDDNWTITPTLMGQKQKANGFFGEETILPHRQVAQYNPEWGRDEWFQAALTVEGKIGNWDLVYSGGYMKRKTPGDSDYSDYAYFYDSLYGSGASFYDNDDNLVSPNQYIQSRPRYKRQSHELRLTSAQDKPVRALVGLFYQRQQNDIEEHYIIDDIADDLVVPGTDSNIWLTKQRRIDRDYAIFGELAWDITEQLTLTGGARAYKYKNSLVGFFGYSAGYSSRTGVAACFGPAEVDGSPCTNLDKTTSDTGWLPKVNLTYKVTDDALVYATYSQGFRPGGINRRGTLPPYQSDQLDNFELGWKTSWADNTIRFNGAVYQLNWKDIQFSALGENGLTTVANAGDGRIRGFELDLTWVPAAGFTLSGSSSFNDAKLTTDFCSVASLQGNCPADLVLAPSGTRLPDTPRFKANVIGRYEWTIGDSADMHVQGAFVYEGERNGDLRTETRQIVGDFPSYTNVDISAGFTQNNWSVELYATNLFDSKGITSRSVQCGESVCGDPEGVTQSGGIFYNYTMRPRTIGLKAGYRF
ncbi:TonB-dependent receptor [Sandaracinobacteroides hominis]|uniref:TonB-dependent receptor n=1 Tax=Sandaracinobacteroides hominis TaxID=2780086 RepID=UPI0018F68139|nr:TonB-dependent receptor [Sandaracinobacteroides hominis]